MDKIITELLVLGRLPGTGIEISFWHFLTAMLVLGCLLLLFGARHLVTSYRFYSDPYYGAPKELNPLDLFAL